MSRALVALLLALTNLVALADTAVAARRFVTGYAGTLPPAQADRAGTYFDKPPVRSLLEQLERGPVTREQATKSLAASNTSLDELVRMKLVATNGSRVRLGFAYFTEADIRRIRSVAERYVPDLVRAYLEKAEEFDRIWSVYPVASVDHKRVAFVVIAGVSLNWDALDALDDNGWRKAILVEGKNWQYSFFASEEVPEFSYRGYFWGSSAFPADTINLDPPLDFSFASFGDPLSEPRMNFPDLLGTSPEQMTPAVRHAAELLGLRDEPAYGLSHVVGLARARDVGNILFALRNGARDVTTLEEVTHAADLAQVLDLLIATGYVGNSADGAYVLTAPVFDRADRGLVEAAVALHRQVLTHWLKTNYVRIRADLSGLTASRQGVPYEALFTQIWHELFGLATRQLVAQGMLADPYAQSNPSPGSLGVVWRVELYRHRWR